MNEEYPAGYALIIKILDSIILLVGLCTLAAPIALHLYPGSYDTMLHTTFGALIVILAFFRVALAYGSAWIEIVLCFLGVMLLTMPRWMDMTYDPTYNMGHTVGGIVVIVCSIISGLSTWAYLRRRRHPATPPAPVAHI